MLCMISCRNVEAETCWSVEKAHGFASHNCEKARQAGFKVYLDTAVRLGHKGDRIITMQDVVNSQKEKAHAQEGAPSAK